MKPVFNILASFYARKTFANSTTIFNLSGISIKNPLCSSVSAVVKISAAHA